MALAAAVAAMAFAGAGSASAAVLCESAPQNGECPESSVYGEGTKVSAESLGAIVFTTMGGTVLSKCDNASYSTEVTDAGGENSNVELSDSDYAFKACTNTTTTIKLGFSEIGWPDSGNGLLVQGGHEFRVSGVFGATCVFGFGAANTFGLSGGSPAVVEYDTVIHKLSGGFTCPARIVMQGKLGLTNPSALYVAQL